MLSESYYCYAVVLGKQAHTLQYMVSATGSAAGVASRIRSGERPSLTAACRCKPVHTGLTQLAVLVSTTSESLNAMQTRVGQD